MSFNDEDWNNVAYSGEVDFHALAVASDDPNWVIGVDTNGPRLRESRDGGVTWDRGIALDVYDLAVQGWGENTVAYATTGDGLWRTRDQGRTWEPDQAAPALVLVSAEGDIAVGIDEQLRVWCLRGQEHWEELASSPSQPVALLLAAGELWVADASGTLWRSPLAPDLPWEEAYSS